MQKILAWIRRQAANQQDIGIEGENTKNVRIGSYHVFQKANNNRHNR
jgi:hypothetical protein